MGTNFPAESARLAADSPESLTYANGQSILRPSLVQDRSLAKKRLGGRQPVVLVVLPEDFRRQLQRISGVLPQ